MTAQPLTVVAPPTSLGLRWYAGHLTDAVTAAGFPAVLVDRAWRPDRAHWHLGNSSRGLIPAVAAAGARHVVTIHDVIPRDPRLRRAWGVVAPRLLRRHQVVVHSRHALGMLRELGVEADAHVVRLAVEELRLPAERVAQWRAELSADDRPVVLTAGVLKVAKGVLEVLASAAALPDLLFVLAGRPADEATRAALAAAPPNVVLREGLSDQDFRVAIAAADVLLNFRTDWVGEASGPVGLAHGLGTPVIGYASGGLEEYCGEEDLLVPPGTPVLDVLRQAGERLHAGWPRLPLGAPQVTTWEQSAAEHLALYGSLGWATTAPERGHLS